MKKSIKKNLKKLASPTFVIFLLLAFALWYINELSHTYTATVDIPVKIGSGTKQYMECRVQGTGYRILSYKMFPGRHIVNIDSGDLSEMGTTGEVTASMLTALSGNISDITILSVKPLP